MYALSVLAVSAALSVTPNGRCDGPRPAGDGPPLSVEVAHCVPMSTSTSVLSPSDCLVELPSGQTVTASFVIESQLHHVEATLRRGDQ